MKIPEAVVFDLGKVLVDFDYSLVVNRIAARCNGNSCDLRQFVTPDAALLYDYEIGRITSEAFFAEVQKATGFPGDATEFGRSFADIFTPIQPMIDLHEKLRSRGMPTYIFSNTNPLAVNHIRERFPFFKNFTAYVLSYEHGAMKPQSKLYEVVERTVGKKGADILYIDDRLENVQAGSERGWQTILQETPEKTLRRIAEIGL